MRLTPLEAPLNKSTSYKSKYSAWVWPGQQAKISPSRAPAQPKQPGQAAGSTSPGRPKGENRLGSSPSSVDVSADITTNENKQMTSSVEIGGSWSTQEDIALCESWVNVSHDPIMGNEMKFHHMWSKIH
ncbi:hypothetical protein L3X38_013733 [Prunus dulcis]|uniref:No apical meristem-associated C-terminal domain-containing protein n=1 Tax=Prunus dulcis TaxID=3755 RepID=A0AAD4WPA5_PRUDU|nr:hypothetical protein L3X38_013733 [Prunus dulcis]